MKSPAQVLAKYMADVSLAGAWPVYTSGGTDEAPDDDSPALDSITIKDTTGAQEARLLTGANVVHPGVQVAVSAGTHEDGEAKIEAIASGLATAAGATVTIGAETFTLRGARQTAPPLSLGVVGGKRRNLFTLNLLLTL